MDGSYSNRVSLLGVAVALRVQTTDQNAPVSRAPSGGPALVLSSQDEAALRDAKQWTSGDIIKKALVEATSLSPCCAGARGSMGLNLAVMISVGTDLAKSFW